MRHDPVWRHAEYLMYLLPTDELQNSVERVVAALEGFEFDAIAFRGMSGALISIPVALRLGKSMLLVRKPGEDNHSGATVEGDKAARSYIILDDMVATGATVRAIVKAVEEFSPEAKFLGVMEVNRLKSRELGDLFEGVREGRVKLIMRTE